MSNLADRRSSRSDAYRTDGGRADQLKSADGQARRARLLERDAYLSELRTVLSDDWDRPVGPIVVEGRCGHGKTAFLGAACQIATDAGCAVLRARMDGPRSNVFSSVVVQLLNSYPTEFTADVLSIARPEDAMAELEKLVCHLVGPRTVAIAVDDSQWLDERSVAALRSLAAHGRGRTRLIMSATPRSPQLPVRPVDQILSEPGVRVMPLAPLSSSAVGTLVGQYLRQCSGEPADGAFVRACHEATGGVPLLVFALLGELAIRRVPPVVASVGSVATTTSQAVTRSVLGRLSLLSGDALCVLEATVVAEEPTDFNLIAEVTELGPARVRAAARMLAAVDLLTPEPALSVQIPIVRRTVYEAIEATHRAKLHLGFAKCLKIRGACYETIADHLVQAEPGHHEWIARELVEAASTAMRTGAPARAVLYLRRAFAERPAAWEDPLLLLELARAEMDSDPRAALEQLLRSLDRGAEPRQTAGVVRQLALRVDRCDATAVSEPEIRQALGAAMDRIAARLSEVDISERIELQIAGALVAGPPFASAAVDSLRPGLVGLRLGSEVEHKAAALVAIADIASQRAAETSEVADRLRRVLTDDYLCSDDPIDCQLWARALVTLARAGDFESADRMTRHALALTRSPRSAAARADYLLTLAMSLTMQGAIIEAHANVLQSLSLVDRCSWARLPDAVACLVGSLIDQGQLGEADRIVSRYRGLELEVPAFEGPLLLEQRGRLRARQGRPADALSDLVVAARRAEERGVDSPVVTAWRSEAAQLHFNEGHEAQAVLLAEANLDLARAHGASWVVGSALRVAAMVGDEDKRLRTLEEAVGLLENSPARLQLALALTDLGRALREAGLPLARARAVLRHGVDIASRLGAAPVVSAGMTELRLSGARPRRAAQSGPHSLTSGEERVVVLAARGVTNSDIASTLFLAEKTVEGHLVRAYRKLGVRSRGELKRVLYQNGSSTAEVIRLKTDVGFVG